MGTCLMDSDGERRLTRFVAARSKHPPEAGLDILSEQEIQGWFRSNEDLPWFKNPVAEKNSDLTTNFEISEILKNL